MKILFTLESSAGMEVKMKQIKGGVTAAKGFKAASTAAGNTCKTGIKYIIPS